MDITDGIKKNDAQNELTPHVWGIDGFRILSDLQIFKSAQKNIVAMYAIEGACSSHAYVCTYSVETLVNLSGISEATVKRTFRELEEKGIVYNLVRPGKGKNDTTARIFTPEFISLLARIQEERKGLKPADAAALARKLFTAFVDNLVENEPMEGSARTPGEEGDGGQPDISNPNEGGQPDPQNTGTDLTDQTPEKKSKDIKTSKKFSADFFNNIKDLSGFIRRGIESRQKYIGQLWQKRASKRADSKFREDPMFPASFKGKVYTVPAGFRS